MKLSIVIPTLNEAEYISGTLQDLQALRQRGHQIILVDGGSHDGTPHIAEPYVDLILHTAAGRSRQMNQGAVHAMGDVLLFLHADSRLPEHADAVIREAIEENNAVWGRFDVRLSGAKILLRIIERLMNWRSAITGIATGDQAIFIKHAIFEHIRGYADVPIMEDIDISKRLKPYSRPARIKQKLTTSSRRWEDKGILRTIFIMWSLRLAYFFGVNPKRLVDIYYPPRSIQKEH